MYVVTGANGQTGSHVLKTLLKHNAPARALVRRPEQADAWRKAGAEAVVVDLADATALAGTFADAAGVYLMNPPAYSVSDIFDAAASVHTAEIAAAERAEVQHIVALSSVGAQHDHGTGNILTTHDLENQLLRSWVPSTVLRAANFMENWAWSLKPALETGMLPSMFSPVTRALPMVSVQDIGRVAAELLMAGPDAGPLVELHGPRDYSPKDAADALSRLTGKPVVAVATPESEWSDTFRASGFSQSATDAFCAMYRGFNDGRVVFSGEGITKNGVIGLGVVLDALMSRDGGHQ